MHERGYRSVLVVSSYFHISRTRLAFHGFGVDEVRSAHARVRVGPRDLWSLLREFAGYYVYLVRPYT